MNIKKLSKFTICLMLVSCLFITGCGTKKPNSKLESGKDAPSFLVDINYDTLMAARNSTEDSFIVLFYRDVFEGNEAYNVVKEYADDNKMTIYRFDLDAYAKEYAEKKYNKEDEEKYVENCKSEVIEIDEEEDEEKLQEGTSYSEEENKITQSYTYSSSECKDGYKQKLMSDAKEKVLEQFNVQDGGDLAFVNNTFVLGTFTNFLPIAYPLMEKEAKVEALEKSKADLRAWLGDIVKQYGNVKK